MTEGNVTFPSLEKGGLSAPVSRSESGWPKGRVLLPQAPRARREPPLTPPFQGGGPGGASGERIRSHILSEAQSWLGTPYVHQASAKGAGCDCLGLVRGVWRGVYGSEPELPPPYTPDWNERAWLRGARREPLLEAARRNLRELPPTERRPGDVLVFRVLVGGPAKHCGVLTAPDRFIHAYAGRGVVESWLSRWWVERLAGTFAFPGAEGNRN